MSAHVVAGFLPWTVDYLKSKELTRKLWDLNFPAEVLENCPAPVLLVPLGWGSLPVRWPLVATFCLIGIFGGICSGAHVLLARKTGSQRVSGYFMWGFAFIWYGLMCLGALFTHSIQTNYTGFFSLLDVIATGCTGISSVGGFLCMWKVIDDRHKKWQIAAVSVYSALNILAVTGSPWLRDQVYIAPTAACVLCLVRHRRTIGKEIRSRELVSPDDHNAKAAEKWLDLGVVGATLALGSVVADQWLCYSLGSHGSCLFWIFLGSDISLFSTYKFITVRPSPSGPGSKKSKAM